jgi:hypothetical protein
LSQTAVAFDALGAATTLTATVKDQNGNTMPGQPVSWMSPDASIAAVAAGTVTAVGNGETTVRAASGNLSAEATITVEQSATQLIVILGDAQAGQVGSQLPESLVVELRDRLGSPVPGGTGGQVVNSVVTFAVTSGGGSVSPTSASVTPAGRAAAAWTLGQTPGAQTASASLAGGGADTTFNATASAGPANALVKVSGETRPVRSPRRSRIPSWCV